MHLYSILFYYQIIFHMNFVICFLFIFFRAALQHIEVPRLGVELELHLPAYTIDTATWDP